MIKRSHLTILPVAEAKRHFSDLIDRVERGEQILVSRHGKLVLALVPPRGDHLARSAPIGLAAVAGALGDWSGIEHLPEEIRAARRKSKDRDVPDFD